MPFNVEGAIAEGYSPAEIADHLASTRNFNVKGAREEGYSDDEIIQHLSKKSTKASKASEKSAPYSTKDVALSLGQGVVGAGKSLTDIFGATNPVSEKLEGWQKSLGESMTPERQEEMKRRQQIIDQAHKSGKLSDEISSYLGVVTDAPVQALAQGLGSVVPYIGTGIVGGVAKLGGATIKALNTIVGAIQGAGSIKGSIYSEIRDRLVESGMSETEAKEKASKAQETLGPNFLNILSGAALGGYAARTGVQNEFIKGSAEKASEKLLPRVAHAVAEEIPAEAAQGGQEQYAQNVAAQREGFDVPTFQDVLGSAARDAAVAGITAGTVGALHGPKAGLKQAKVEQEQAKVEQEQAKVEQEQTPPSPIITPNAPAPNLPNTNIPAANVTPNVENVAPNVTPNVTLNAAPNVENVAPNVENVTPNAPPVIDDAVRARATAFVEKVERGEIKLHGGTVMPIARALNLNIRGVKPVDALEQIKQILATPVVSIATTTDIGAQDVTSTNPEQQATGTGVNVPPSGAAPEGRAADIIEPSGVGVSKSATESSVVGEGAQPAALRTPAVLETPATLREQKAAVKNKTQEEQGALNQEEQDAVNQELQDELNNTNSNVAPIVSNRKIPKDVFSSSLSSSQKEVLNSELRKQKEIDEQNAAKAEAARVQNLPNVKQNNAPLTAGDISQLGPNQAEDTKEFVDVNAKKIDQEATATRGESEKQTLPEIAESAEAIKNPNDPLYQSHLDNLVDYAQEITEEASSKEKTNAAKALKNVPEEVIQASRERIINLKRNFLNQEQKRHSKNILNLNYKLDELTDDLNDAKALGYEDDINNILSEIKETKDRLTEAHTGLKLVKESSNRITTVEAGPLRRRAAGETGGGLPKETIQGWVDELKKEWKNAPRTNIFQHLTDLKKEVYDEAVRDGKFNPEGFYYKGEVYLIADNIHNKKIFNRTIIHETIGHFGLGKILGNRYKGTLNAAYFNKDVKEMADYFRKLDPELSKLDSIEEALATMAEEYYYKRGPIRSIIDKLTNIIREAIRAVFGQDAAGGLTDSEIHSLIQTSAHYVRTGEGASTSAPKDAGKIFRRTSGREAFEDLTDSYGAKVGKQQDEKFSKKAVGDNVGEFFRSPAGYQWIVRKFQNDRVTLKNLQDLLKRAGKLIVGEENFNNIYDLITLSAGKAHRYLRQYVSAAIKDLDTAVLEYSKASGIDIKAALNRLHAILTGLHEPERRMIKYLKNVPLDDKTQITVDINGAPVTDTPANLRKIIFNIIETDTDLVTNGGAAELRSVLNDIVEQHKDANGYSPAYERATKESAEEAKKGAKAKKPIWSTDINSFEYNVIGDLTPEQLAAFQQSYEADMRDPAKAAALIKLRKALKNVQEGTIELDKRGNYWSQPVSNLKEFYGYENYIPFKGKTKISEKDDADTDPRSTRRSNDYKETQHEAEGRTSDADNPLLQSRADAARAALRAGRVDVPMALKNLIDQGYVAGDIGPVVSFKDKQNFDFRPYSSSDHVFLHQADGSIQILKVKDVRIAEAIHRSFREVQPVLQMLNAATSTVGMLHTRYNMAFAPMNFVRDMLTNAYTMYAEKGFKFGNAYLLSIAKLVLSGGMFKAMRFSKLYNEGNFAEIQRMANKDEFIKNMLEYMEEGGRVSYIQGIAIQGSMQELNKNIGRNRLIQTKEQLDKYVDIWNDTFELTSRAAAYSVAKTNALARNLSEQGARIEAAAYAKNLANFEQVGEWGKAAGAAFMFFRPAATGAVRAIDAISAAFQSVESVIHSLPAALRNDPVAVENVRKDHALRRAQARLTMAGLAGAGAAMYALAFMMSDEDDLDRNRVGTDDMSRWTRYLRLPIPNALMDSSRKDQFFQLPWGFGPGAFAAIGAQVAGTTMGKTSVGDAMAHITQIALDSYIPIPVSRMNPLDNPLAFVVDSVVPSLARPLVEYVMDVDSLGRQIYNNRQSRVGESYTGGDNIPEIYKSTTQWLNQITGGEIMWSPNTLYFFANNYIDGVSRIAETAGNLGMYVSGTKDFDPKNDIPVVSSFIGKASNYDAREFSSVKAQMLKKEAQLNMLKYRPEQLSDYMSNHPMDAMLVKIYNEQTGGLLKTIQTQENIIRGMDLTPKERKDMLDNLKLSQRIVERNIIETFKAYDINP